MRCDVASFGSIGCGHATPGIVHVPEGALGGKFGTVSSHAATVVALLVLSAAEIRRRWFTFLMVAATLLP